MCPGLGFVAVTRRLSRRTKKKFATNQTTKSPTNIPTPHNHDSHSVGTVLSLNSAIWGCGDVEREKEREREQKLTSLRKPRNARSKRALDDREAKLVENHKKTLLLSGTSTSDLTRHAMGDLVSYSTPPLCDPLHGPPLTASLCPTARSQKTPRYKVHQEERHIPLRRCLRL